MVDAPPAALAAAAEAVVSAAADAPVVWADAEEDKSPKSPKKDGKPSFFLLPSHPFVEKSLPIPGISSIMSIIISYEI